jgi:glycosyltransferase involved in cell wall biosynthesis
MIKLLFITYTHSNGGGAENVLTTLVNHLDPVKYKIDIIEVNQFFIKTEPLNKEIRLLSPMVKANNILNTTIHYILYEKPEIIKHLFQLYSYDVIITWNYQLPSFCLRSFENEIKIAWFHGAIYDFLSDAIDARPARHRQLQLRTWETADRIVTISKKSLQSLKDIFPELSDKAEIINNCFDISKIQKLSIMNLKIKLPPNTQNIILGVGRIDNNKNLKLLLHAVINVINSGINCFLIILGDGELLNELQEIASQENIKDFVFFAGYQQNPYPYFKLSKLVCLTSFSEGFPTVIVEGMLLGKPFVTTPVSGASDELADNGKCGLVSDWNVDEYANSIKKLLTDQDLYEEMSEKCIEKAKEYSVENTVNKFDSLIENLQNNNISKNKAVDKKKYSFIKRLYSICYFAFVFAFINKKKSLLTVAFKRFRNKCSPINIVKLFYRLMLFIIYNLSFPLRFFIGFTHGCFLGSR